MSNFILLESAGLVAVPDHYDEEIFKKLWWVIHHYDFKWCNGW